MMWLPDFYRDLVKVNSAEIERRRRGATYPFPGGDTFGEIYITKVLNYTGFPWVMELRGGARLFNCEAIFSHSLSPPKHLHTD